jgi:hypothetical protein
LVSESQLELERSERKEKRTEERKAEKEKEEERLTHSLDPYM